MRLFFDTNVLLSAYAFGGVCRKLIHAAKHGHTVVTGPAVLLEFERHARGKLQVDAATVDAVMDDLRALELADETAVADFQLRDPNDLPILSAAVNSGSDLLITGDNDLLAVAEQVRERFGLRVLPPSAALAELEALPRG